MLAALRQTTGLTNGPRRTGRTETTGVKGLGRKNQILTGNTVLGRLSRNERASRRRPREHQESEKPQASGSKNRAKGKTACVALKKLAQRDAPKK